MLLKRYPPKETNDAIVGTFYAAGGESYLVDDLIAYFKELKEKAEKENLSNIRVKIDMSFTDVLGVRSFLGKFSGMGDQPPREK